MVRPWKIDRRWNGPVENVYVDGSFSVFFQFSRLLTVRIPFQVEFSALLWLLVQIYFSMCISLNLLVISHGHCWLPHSRGSACWAWAVPPLSEQHALASLEGTSCPAWERTRPWGTGFFTLCKTSAPSVHSEYQGKGLREAQVELWFGLQILMDQRLSLG